MITDNDLLNLKLENLDRAAWLLHEDCCGLLERIAELHQLTDTPTHRLERIRRRVATSLASIEVTIGKIKRPHNLEAA